MHHSDRSSASVENAPRPQGARAVEAARVMDSLRRIVHALRQSTAGSPGLSPAQLFVLRQLAQAPGQSMRDIAVRTRTAQSSVSEVIGRLVQMGYVERRTAESDRRRSVLSLTAAGDALLLHAPETVQERLLAGLDRLPVPERGALARGLETWLAVSGLSDVAPKLFFEDGAKGGRGRRGR